MKRKILVGALFVLIISGLIAYFSLSDLRSGYTIPKDNPAKVQALLQNMAKAHNIHLWDSIGTYQVTYGEAFYGLIGKMGNPFNETEAQFSLRYIPGTFTGQLSVLTGKDEGLTWGIQSGQTYTLDRNENLIVEDDKNIQFWLPTYQYFIEFPKRILEANALQYLGTQEIKGQMVDGILASWNTVDPQRDLDQYIIWIGQNDHRIVKIEYTIREMYPFLTGAAYFTKYREFEGLWLPTEFPVESNLVSEGLLHTMRILDFKSDVVKPEELRPIP